MSGSMRPLKIDDTPLYGAPGLLVCGLDDESAGELRALVLTLDWPALPVSFAGRKDLKTKVGTLFRERPMAPENLGGVAVIMAGITGNQLQVLMKSWRASPLPPSLWATLNQTNEHWPLLTLLKHLAEERKEMAKARRSSPPPKE